MAEECFIGFSSRDHSTQTDKNEILDMKELVDIIDTLAVVSSNLIFESIHLKIYYEICSVFGSHSNSGYSSDQSTHLLDE